MWLVGGLAKSPWVFKRLREELEPEGITVSRPETNLYVACITLAIEALFYMPNSHSENLPFSAKAAAHGSILFAVEHPVRSRVTRFTYGTDCSTRYDASNPEHRRRSHLKYTGLGGDEKMPGKFDVIVRKVCLEHRKL